MRRISQPSMNKRIRRKQVAEFVIIFGYGNSQHWQQRESKNKHKQRYANYTSESACGNAASPLFDSSEKRISQQWQAAGNGDCQSGACGQNHKEEGNDACSNGGDSCKF